MINQGKASSILRLSGILSLLIAAQLGLVQAESGGHRLLFSDGQGADGAYGHAIAGAGDLDRDGYEDYIVGSPYADSPYARIMSGKKAGLELARIEKIQDDDQTGFSVMSWAPNDGDDDLIYIAVSSPNTSYEGGNGTVRVFSYDQASSSLVEQYRLEPRPGDGLSVDQPDQRFGAAVTIVGPREGAGPIPYNKGDLNRDGTQDILVSAPYADVDGQENVGVVYVFDGRNGDLFYTIRGEDAGDLFGYSLSPGHRAAGDPRLPSPIFGSPGAGSALHTDHAGYQQAGALVVMNLFSDHAEKIYSFVGGTIVDSSVSPPVSHQLYGVGFQVAAINLHRGDAAYLDTMTTGNRVDGTGSVFIDLEYSGEGETAAVLETGSYDTLDISIGRASKFDDDDVPELIVGQANFESGRGKFEVLSGATLEVLYEENGRFSRRAARRCGSERKGH